MIRIQLKLLHAWRDRTIGSRNRRKLGVYLNRIRTFVRRVIRSLADCQVSSLKKVVLAVISYRFSMGLLFFLSGYAFIWFDTTWKSFLIGLPIIILGFLLVYKGK